MPWDWMPEQHTTFERVSALNHLRQKSFALRRGRLEVVRADDEVLALARITPSETVLILLARNPGNTPVDITLPPHWSRPQLTPLLVSDGVRVEPRAGTVRFHPVPHGYAFLRLGGG
jgi:hypothetical protein